MRIARTLLLAAALALGACDEDGGRTVLVEFDRPPTAAHEDAVLEIGGEVTYRIPLANALAMYGPLLPEEYAVLPDVVEATDLGEGSDPAVTAFVLLDRSPTQADVDFVVSLGARTATPHAAEHTIAASRLPLSSAPRLGENPHVVDVEIEAADLPQPR